MKNNKIAWQWDIPRPPGCLNVGLILKNAALAYPGKEVIDATNGIRRTYKELDERVNRIASGFLERGYKPGDFIALLAGWRIETIEVCFACARTGTIFIPLSYRLSPAEIENLLRFTGAKAIIFEKKFQTMVAAMEVKLDRYVIGESADGSISYTELLKHEPAVPEIEIRDETPLCIGFTSGTTGRPKAYVRTHYSNFINHLGYALSFDLTYQDVGLTAVPPLTGLSWCLGLMLARGVPVVTDFGPETVLKAIEKYKVTIFFGVPAMFKALLDVPSFDRYDLSSLRAVVSVGAPLPISTLEKIWEKMTPNVYEQSGLQEMGFLCAIKPEMKKQKPYSVGPPVPYQDVRIVDKEGRDVPVGEIGEIITRNPDCAGEYYMDEEKTKESFRNGWFYTGDLGKFDEDGYLYIVGRLKDMIITGGYNVYAPDVENVLMSHPKIADCAVIGLPDEKWGEKVVAVAKLKPGESCPEEELINFCKNAMAGYKVPKSVFFVENIPRTASGKVMKFQLIKNFREQKLR